MRTQTTHSRPASPDPRLARRSSGRALARARGIRLAFAAGVAGAALAFALAAAPGALCPQAGALGKGIIDNRLEGSTVSMSSIPTLVDQIGRSGLGAKWTRVLVHWSALQPTSASSYDQAYAAQLAAVVNAFKAQGVTVIFTTVDVPKWAGKSSLWNSPPKGYKKGYQSFYAMDIKRASVRTAFTKLGQYLAANYSVKYFECWNEPNLGSCLYPQKTRSDAKYGERTYVAMLKAFNTGVHRGDKKAVVIAGATAPRGGNDAYSTTPQKFAQTIKGMGATKYCQGYSHHPYVPRGTRNPAPTAKPNNPKTCVTLGNLSTLTKLFPSRIKFYLTEYGYGTHPSDYFGCSVSAAKQAQYLKQAYAFAKKNSRIKALLWFLVQDWSEKGTTVYDGKGAYTGLVDLSGAHKKAWDAFKKVR